MMFRCLAIAGTFVVWVSGVALAQEMRGPRELPPQGFAGEQYVDSGGCVFLRAGIGAGVNWVPRISRERRQLCGMPPSFAPGPVVVAEVAPPVPAATERTAPPEAIVAATAARGAPAARRIALARNVPPVPPVSRAAEPARRLIACPATAPVARRFAVEGGGTRVLCVPPGLDLRVAVAPNGYRLAWTDDRLNPLRGLGTAEGQARQDGVWTRDVPAEPFAVPPAAKRRPAIGEDGGGERVARVDAVGDQTGDVTLSTSTAPRTAVAAKAGRFTAKAGRFLVQVGTFGVASNAEAARGRLVRLGLPVTAARSVLNGKPVQIVYAGPFADVGQAQAALRAARLAGFGDAVLR